MTIHDPIHSPTPEFRAALERDVVAAFRDETRATRPRRFTRFRTPMTLAAGLVLGMSTQLAVGQVQRNRERSALEVAIDVKRSLAGSRLELAKANYELAKKGFDAGTIMRSALLAAEAEWRVQEAAAYRLQLELEEVRITAAAPRDELWAPLVGSRDFVKDRLNADAAAAQRKLEAVEATAAEVERSYQAGVVSKAALNDSRASLEEARAELEAVAYRLTLRRQALDDHLSPQDAMLRLKRFQNARELQRAKQQLEVLREAYETARTRASVGADDNVEVLRLRVQLLETEAQLRWYRERLQELSSKKPE